MRCGSTLSKTEKCTAFSRRLRATLRCENAGDLAQELTRDDARGRLATQLLRLCASDALACRGDDALLPRLCVKPAAALESSLSLSLSRVSRRGRQFLKKQLETRTQAASLRTRQRCWSELRALPLLALADGGVAAANSAPGRGRNCTTSPLLATPEQQQLCPSLAWRFVAIRAVERVPELLSGGSALALEFATAVGLEKFTAATLAQHLGDALPRTWRGARRVRWRPFQDRDETQRAGAPDALWPAPQGRLSPSLSLSLSLSLCLSLSLSVLRLDRLARFWEELSLADETAVALFERWPLIPTVGGALVFRGDVRRRRFAIFNSVGVLRSVETGVEAL